MAGKKMDLTLKNGFFAKSLAFKGLACVSWRFQFKQLTTNLFSFSRLGHLLTPTLAIDITVISFAAFFSPEIANKPPS